MDTRQLAAFCAVVELRSFSQAAERLGVTQPAVSLPVRSLEKRLRERALRPLGGRGGRGGGRGGARAEEAAREASARPFGAAGRADGGRARALPRRPADALP